MLAGAGIGVRWKWGMESSNLNPHVYFFQSSRHKTYGVGFSRGHNGTEEADFEIIFL